AAVVEDQRDNLWIGGGFPGSCGGAAPAARTGERGGRDRAGANRGYGPSVRMLWPDAHPDVSPEELLLSEDRPPHADRPWMLVNMIASIDGAASDELGRSGGLGSAADRRLFLATRALADVIIAGATTVMAEDYGPPRVRAELGALREARGLAPRPRLAVVSGTLSLDPARRLFAEGGEPPIVLTGTAPDPDRRAALAAVAEVIECGTGAPGRVDWHRALAELRCRGYAT